MKDSLSVYKRQCLFLFIHYFSAIVYVGFLVEALASCLLQCRCWFLSTYFVNMEERPADTRLLVHVQDGDANYLLYAVLVHAGWSTHSGHYYCFVRTAGDTWHGLDDSRVLAWQLLCFCYRCLSFCDV